MNHKAPDRFYLLHQYSERGRYCGHRYIAVRDDQHITDFMNEGEVIAAAVDRETFESAPVLYQADARQYEDSSK